MLSRFRHNIQNPKATSREASCEHLNSKFQEDGFTFPFSHYERLGFIGLLPWRGWLPYGLRPSGFLSLLKLAPSEISMRGGVANPKLFATFTRSSLWTSNTERRL